MALGCPAVLKAHDTPRNEATARRSPDYVNMHAFQLPDVEVKVRIAGVEVQGKDDPHTTRED